MTTRLLASLEAAIQQWADETCETADWTQANVWWPDSLTMHMAQAAYAVLKANQDGQKYAKEQDDAA